MSRTIIVLANPQNPRYTIFSFLFDIFMIWLTCGLWLVWMIIRGMKK